MNKVLLGASLAVTLLVSACSQAPAEVQGGLGAQFGTAGDDGADVVSTDAARGRVYVAGGHKDNVVFFRRYNRDGSPAWKTDANTRVSGGSAGVNDADVDSAGNVYFAWYTSGSPSVPGVREPSAFISKYTSSGRLLFRKALPGASLHGLATDASGNVYVTVARYGDAGTDYFVRKFSSGGLPVWTKELRVPDEDFGGDMGDVAGLDVAPDGSVFVAAARMSYGGLLFKLRGSDGKQLKLSPVGGQFALDVAVAAGAVYVHSYFDAPHDGQPYVSKFRLDGSSVWLREGDVSTDETRYDAGSDLSADAAGNVYLVGSYVTDESFGVRDTDLLVRKYTPSGGVAYNRRFINPGTRAYGSGVAVSGSDLYVVGATDGPVNGTDNGGNDAFLMRLNAQGQKVWER